MSQQSERETDAARRRWLKERGRFDLFGCEIQRELQSALAAEGLKTQITSRAKDVDSLLKKLILKPSYTYETLGDKAGVRVVVRYRHEVARVVSVIRRLYECDEPEDKADFMDADQVGYLSTHVAVWLRTADARSHNYPPEKFRAELQVRTLAQHLWSEMAHDATYKASELINQSLTRRVHLMAGLIEVADNEFSRLDTEISGIPGMTDAMILKALERQYLKLTARRSNPELSLAIIRRLRPLYGSAPEDWNMHFERLFAEKGAYLREVFGRAESNGSQSALLFQPEALMIYDRLAADEYRLRETWAQEFPPEELERLANDFGFSFA